MKNSVIINNCPALFWDSKRFKKCFNEHGRKHCKDVDCCIIKQLYQELKKCNCEQINLLEVEEVKNEII